MLIDFHTHAFPDKIAGSAIFSLSQKAGGLTALTDGSVHDLSAKMKNWGVDRFVLLNIATKPRQQTNVNNFAISQNGGSVVAFGSVHPDSPDVLSELERIAAAGLLGVKFHPEYQGFRIDDKKAYPLYEKCQELGLIMVFHAGKDIGFPDSLAASPSAVKKVLKDFPNSKMVMAHMGGWMMWDEVEELVAGLDGYIDTSFTYGYISAKQATRIIKKHGAERVLFGSDCPWASPEQTARFIHSLDLTEQEKQLIFYQNALRLLGEKTAPGRD